MLLHDKHHIHTKLKLMRRTRWLLSATATYTTCGRSVTFLHPFFPFSLNLPPPLPFQDLVANIQPGVPQNMASNVYALLVYLSTSPSSPLPRLAEAGYTPPSTVFFSYLGWFFVYSFKWARWGYATLVVAVLVFVWGEQGSGVEAEANGDARVKMNGSAMPNGNGASPPGNVANGNGNVHLVYHRKLTRKPCTRTRAVLRGTFAVLSSLLGTLLVPNLIALVLDKLLGKGMSWFSNEYSVIALFAPAALLGEFPPPFFPILFPFRFSCFCSIIQLHRRTPLAIASYAVHQQRGNNGKNNSECSSCAPGSRCVWDAARWDRVCCHLFLVGVSSVFGIGWGSGVGRVEWEGEGE